MVFNLILYSKRPFIIKKFKILGERFKQTKQITFKQLRQRIKAYQTKLKEFGVKKDDRVVGYLPNCIEYVEAKLATISLGAVWSCASPDFGSQVFSSFLSLKKFNQIFNLIIINLSLL